MYVKPKKRLIVSDRDSMHTSNCDGSAVSSSARAVEMSSNKKSIVLSIALVLAMGHFLVIGFVAHPLLPSNIIQFAAPVLATWLCLQRARGSVEAYFRRLWYKLSIAFLIWAIAQAVYLWHVIASESPPHFPSLTDFLWLLFSFPILLTAARAQDRTENDWTGFLDITQACFSVCLLYGVVFVVPGGYSDSIVYDIQSIALLFACSIRYSTATTVKERIFFRDLTIYVIFYAVITAAGVLAQDLGSPAPGITDLAWSMPTLIFCIIVAGLPEKVFKNSGNLEKRRLQTILPAHIHGVGSLGLALTSMAAGVLMIFHRPGWGIPALAIACILFALRTAIRESQLKRAQVKLEYDSLHDNLTGLANRAMLIRELENSVLTPWHRKSLLFLDLDRFKEINDSLGHVFGDRILQHVAHVLRSSIRPDDMVARLGGDEFVILMNDGNANSSSQAMAARILHNLHTPSMIEGRVIQLTGSIGIVAVEEGATTTRLLRDADAAMYNAKSQGKNRVRIFDQKILDKRTRELDMEADLLRALTETAITVDYQPIYSLEGEAIEGFEALARWHHPQYGAISPSDFIPLAEDTGLILELGRQVLDKACSQIAFWNRFHGTTFTLNVNVSARQLADPDFLPYLQAILEQNQLKPELIKFEVRESVFLHEEESIQKVLAQAHAIGITICLDGFGTGYSSLNSLLQLPFDVLKLDRVLFQDIEGDKKRRQIMEPIIQLAKILNKKVVAKGIETSPELELFAELQCDSVQGFLLTRPVIADHMAEVLKTELHESRLIQQLVGASSLPAASASSHCSSTI